MMNSKSNQLMILVAFLAPFIVVMLGCWIWNLQVHNDLPIVLAGGGAGQINGGRHLRYPEDTPTTNLFLTLLDKLEIPLENFGDSTGRLELLPL